MSAKVVFFTGGVFSSVGKGLTLANVGRIFKELGFKISALKFDPYLNIDSGNLSPDQHGEVYVTSDGHETDLDLGHYERFMDYELSRYSCITAGKIFKRILSRQEKRGFSGETIQVVPHLIDEIHKSIYDILEKEPDSDFLFIEIGGTVGDMESLPFIEAASSFKHKYGKNNVLFIHISPILYLSTVNEHKTKPTQHSIRQLTRNNIFPDLLILRSSVEIPNSVKSKISLTSQIKEEDILVCQDHKNIYLIAESLYEEKIHEKIFSKFGIPLPKGNLNEWKKHTSKILSSKDKRIRVALVGKYSTSEAYISIIESFNLASYSLNVDLDIDFLGTDEIDDLKCLDKYDSICVPHGFGSRGVDEKIKTIRYCREKGVPFLGICFGMQLTVIEYARNVLGFKDANSTELDKKTPIPLFITTSDEKMRLGRKKVKISNGTFAQKLFKTDSVNCRHRHRYRFNNEYLKLFENTDLVFSAFSDDSDSILEAIELKNHDFFVATQFHPEFETKFSNISPLFIEFLKSGLKRKYEKA